jgi:hypothetical protein
MVNNGPRQIKDLLGGHLTSCIKNFNNGDPLLMLPMLVVKKRMNTIKQHGKENNVCQKSHNISQFY